MMEVFAGLTLGFAGSVHCVAMCGPLVLAWGHARVRRVALYHGARVAVYAAAGLLGGLAGQALDIAGLGRVLSIAAGALLLLTAAQRMGLMPAPRAGGWISRRLASAMRAVRGMTAEHPVAGVLAAGALNALLPCGLVYAAIAAATTFGSAGRAIAFMVSFGLGTVPALAAISLLGHAVPLAVRSRARLAAPLALALLGLMLIARGVATERPDAVTAGHPAGHVHIH
jgi:sulfite exporter TauE/SafE